MTQGQKDNRGNLQALLGAMADLYAGEGRAGGDAAAMALREACACASPSAQSAIRTDSTRPSTDKIAEMVCAAEKSSEKSGATPSLAIMPHLHAVMAQLDWYYFGLDDALIDADTAAQMATVELVGPDGMFFNPTLRAGVFMQDAGVHYSTRTHPAEETFIMISGMARWGRGWQDTTTDHHAGDMIFHESMVPHSTRTFGAPFVALWRWNGDIRLDGYELAVNGEL